MRAIARILGKRPGGGSGGRPSSRALRRQRGLTLIETALVLGIAALMAVYFASMLADNAERTKGKAVAEKLEEVHRAAAAYVKAKTADLITYSNTNAVFQVPLTGAAQLNANLRSLETEGFLPASFRNVNGYNQTHRLLVRRAAANQIEAMVVTVGGTTIADAQLGAISALRGAAGGFVPATNVVAADANNVVGAYGGWRSPLANWAALRPAVGHLASTLALGDGNGQIADYLYRKDIGIPEANRMSTDIDMDGNDLNNVAVIKGVGTVGNEALTIQNDLVARRDVWAGRNLNVTNNATIGVNANIGNNANVGRDVTAGRDVNATRDVTVGRDLYARTVNPKGGSVTFGEGTRNNGVNTVTDAADVIIHGDLRAESVDLNTLVYDSRDNAANGSNRRDLSRFVGTRPNIRLGDLMPKMVPQYTYSITPQNNVVPKPDCAGGYDNARIQIFRHTDTAVFQVTAGNPFGYARTVSMILATDRNASWEVNWYGDKSAREGPGGSAAQDRNPARRAIALTACYYER